jgi:hypothetical protein
MQAVIKESVDPESVFTKKNNGTLVAEIEWSDQPPATAQQIQTLLGTWLLMYFGHWFVI